MAYRKVGNIIGPTIERAEHIEQDPWEKFYGTVDEFPEAFRAREMQERNLAQGATIAAKERAEPKEAIIDVKDVAQMREEQIKLWGKDNAEYYQSFGKFV